MDFIIIQALSLNFEEVKLAFIKRIFLFLLLNFLIVLTASIGATFLMQAFNLQGEIAFYIVFYSLIGFGGAFISLALSRWFAKKVMQVRVIDPQTKNPQERELLDMVYHLAKMAKLPAQPEVGIYEKQEMNAFATGPSKKRSLVAVSRGLLNSMSKQELEGVLGHEIAHIANGDMVTMTLLQGLINTMVLIVARLIARVIASQQRSRSFWMEHLIFIGLQIVFSILGMLVLCYFSRKREYRADKGGAKLAGTENMILALKALKRNLQPQPQVSRQQESYNYLQISSTPKRNWFSTHPPLEDRIARLERSYS